MCRCGCRHRYGCQCSVRDLCFRLVGGLSDLIHCASHSFVCRGVFKDSPRLRALRIGLGWAVEC